MKWHKLMVLDSFPVVLTIARVTEPRNTPKVTSNSWLKLPPWNNYMNKLQDILNYNKFIIKCGLWIAQIIEGFTLDNRGSDNRGTTVTVKMDNPKLIDNFKLHYFDTLSSYLVWSYTWSCMTPCDCTWSCVMNLSINFFPCAYYRSFSIFVAAVCVL